MVETLATTGRIDPDNNAGINQERSTIVGDADSDRTTTAGVAGRDRSTNADRIDPDPTSTVCRVASDPVVTIGRNNSVRLGAVGTDSVPLTKADGKDSDRWANTVGAESTAFVFAITAATIAGSGLASFVVAGDTDRDLRGAAVSLDRVTSGNADGTDLDARTIPAIPGRACPRCTTSRTSSRSELTIKVDREPSFLGGSR